jgi:hypothetical protein
LVTYRLGCQPQIFEQGPAAPVLILDDAHRPADTAVCRLRMIARIGRFGVSIDRLFDRLIDVHELHQFVKRIKLPLEGSTD